VLELLQFSPEKYTEAIQYAGRNGYSVLVIDSLSHAWEGVGGALEIKDRQGGNQWTAWRNVTPIHNRMVDAILQAPLHVITCMRSRMEYVQETDSNGKISIRKVGMAPIQRPGMEYEFDVVCDIDWAHILTVSKSRCSAVADMKMEKPGPGFVRPIMDWLNSGQAIAPVAPKPEPDLLSPVSISLFNLVTQYSAQAVMDANGGVIPGTEAELAAVALKLGGAK
jgi:hypothetical protein